MEAMAAIGDLFVALLIVMVLKFALDFVVYLCFTISLIKKGIDPVRYYQMIDNGQVPAIIPVEINAKTVQCEIANRWHGRGQFGFIIKTNNKEQSVSVTEEEWNTYKTGDKIIMGMEIVKNRDTGEIMEDCCRYYVLNNAPNFDMMPAEMPLGQTMIVRDKSKV